MRAEPRADWLPVREARERILAAVAPLPPERRPLLDALGRVLAEEIVSPVDLPPWDNSAMDGFAVRAEDVRGASEPHPRALRVVDDIPAGGVPSHAIRAGEASRIMTGAPVPEGADTIVRVEHTDGGSGIGTERGRVRIHSDTDAGRNLRARGEDVRTGDAVLHRGVVLRPAEIGVAASLGRSGLRVVRHPVVAILASGDELVETDGFAEVLAGRRIVSSNSYTLAAALRELGMEARLLGIARDTTVSLREHLEAARGCDALVTTAGVSVGEHDQVRSVLDALGLRPEFWRVRMRPGSPLGFGRVDGLGGIPWFGLPGNPVSTLVAFEVFVRPALLWMAGHRAVFPPVVEARTRDALRLPPGLTHFLRARLHRGGDGTVGAALTGPQGSGILTSMAAADALLVVPEGRGEFAEGEALRAIVLGGAPLREEAGY